MQMIANALGNDVSQFDVSDETDNLDVESHARKIRENLVQVKLFRKPKSQPRSLGRFRVVYDEPRKFKVGQIPGNLVNCVGRLTISDDGHSTASSTQSSKLPLLFLEPGQIGFEFLESGKNTWATREYGWAQINHMGLSFTKVEKFKWDRSDSKNKTTMAHQYAVKEYDEGSGIATIEREFHLKPANENELEYQGKQTIRFDTRGLA